MKGFNTKTYVSRELRLTELSRTLKLDKDEKTELKGVKSISIEYLFDSERTGLKINDNVSMIYVYKVVVLEDIVPMLVLKKLDKNTNTHTIFEVVYDDKYTYVIANKRLNDSIVVGEYYTKSMSEWEYNEISISTLEQLHLHFVSQVIDLPNRQDESARELVERKKNIKSIEVRIAKLESKKTKEIQFNKKIALNDQIREFMCELVKLK